VHPLNVTRQHKKRTRSASAPLDKPRPTQQQLSRVQGAQDPYKSAPWYRKANHDHGQQHSVPFHGRPLDPRGVGDWRRVAKGRNGYRVCRLAASALGHFVVLYGSHAALRVNLSHCGVPVVCEQRSTVLLRCPKCGIAVIVDSASELCCVACAWPMEKVRRASRWGSRSPLSAAGIRAYIDRIRIKPDNRHYPTFAIRGCRGVCDE